MIGFASSSVLASISLGDVLVLRLDGGGDLIGHVGRVDGDHVGLAFLQRRGSRPRPSRGCPGRRTRCPAACWSRGGPPGPGSAGRRRRRGERRPGGHDAGDFSFRPCHPDQLPVPPCHGPGRGRLAGCSVSSGLSSSGLSSAGWREMSSRPSSWVRWMSPCRCAWSITQPASTLVPATRVHLHPFEQEAERFAQLAAKSQPVPSALCPVAVHPVQARTQAGDLSPLPAVST